MSSQIESDQSILGPDFHGGEVDGSQHFSVRFQEDLLGSLPFTLRGWLDTVLFKMLPMVVSEISLSQVGGRPWIRS